MRPWFAGRYLPYKGHWAQNHTFAKIQDGGGRHLVLGFLTVF